MWSVVLVVVAWGGSFSLRGDPRTPEFTPLPLYVKVLAIHFPHFKLTPSHASLITHDESTPTASTVAI